ncbi:MAG: PqqD family protein [Deltaproteobacteria bacterium]|nr:PqqD family protein [Deltaproteobacteria bacterium]
MSCPRLADGVQRRPLPGGEEVVTSSDGATAVILNAVGAAVADLCTGKRSADEIAELVASCFSDVDVDSVRRDVDAVLGKLRDSGVLAEG